MTKRTATIHRKTKETQIELTLTLDGDGNSHISTGVGFLDHMLDLLTKHGLFDLTIHANGDRIVDDHHTVEDVGICFGQGIKEALGDKKGIRRFSNSSVPMQEALAHIAVDISGRPALVFNVTFHTEKIGNFDVELIEEFLEAFSTNAGINLHVNVPYGSNAHHIAEAIFKGLAKALGDAVRIDARIKDIPSTKGVL
ncbi:MAG: imidazoleglycerol-phosphate dehydratase HisB [Candidatus Brocadia sp. AMX2]|uniref:Imidazoleglycerol-phosphate dehydratase n=1 Tax=Candidatus Brocadia sinica JPN1 TaxID=1197129 RepID=A0ABQ0JWY1_9BACT|nr:MULTISPECIES: imidazoleglycerol-phosphate dehydratase HisB [Brocadia]MBC6931820.1 imidazoleglycerol-phosphate dehydratase HisB [Candidatus Brocadia sp.]MBL1167325.1 imidazoleglycerol-phosphate dehydratase HisB [Candidatus Brocadia sp. AMX1]MCK6466803.1 imidazoleglycerol-phosphate dehydratase HisB [Candidatus Brocadia sinica]NOG41202.1 imidazoleglycerol-phosphate dehydratase HisB [Planctomycetota bacterium]KAA0245731.1 MAG: imidazoleglycerol-phosphate dehydratase HisB [Candidatus Brocadia sp